MGFSVNADYGATASKKVIQKELLNAAPGSIVIMHMNRPGKGALQGLKDALPELRKRGVRFVRLSEYKLS